VRLTQRPRYGQVGRALAFVRWLAAEHPAGGWAQFLTADGGDPCAAGGSATPSYGSRASPVIFVHDSPCKANRGGRQSGAGRG
jgi:hypothetical protein